MLVVGVGCWCWCWLLVWQGGLRLLVDESIWIDMVTGFGCVLLHSGQFIDTSHEMVQRWIVSNRRNWISYLLI